MSMNFDGAIERFVGQLFEDAWYFSNEFDATELNGAIECLKTAYPNGVNLVAFLEDRLEEKLDDEDGEEE